MSPGPTLGAPTSPHGAPRSLRPVPSPRTATTRTSNPVVGLPRTQLIPAAFDDTSWTRWWRFNREPYLHLDAWMSAPVSPANGDATFSQGVDEELIHGHEGYNTLGLANSVRVLRSRVAVVKLR